MSLEELFGTASSVETSAEPRCSRRGCGAPADRQLLWNNPRIHTPERRKVWLACPEHAEWLTDYLTERGLFRSSEPMDTSLPKDTSPQEAGE